MLSGWTLALSSLVLCLSMQNFAPVSRLALDPYSLNASLGFPYPAQNSWPPVGLQTTGPYQQQGPYQPQQGHQWNAPQVTQNNSTIFYPSTPLQQNQNHQFNFTNPISGPNYKGWSQLTYQTWQQPQAVRFVAVPDTSLASDAAIPPLSVTPFGLAAAIQAPPARQHSYASVAKSDAYEAISGQGRGTKTIFSASLDDEQAIRLVKRATRWQDSDSLLEAMIAKDGDKLTLKMFKKLFPKLQSNLIQTRSKEFNCAL